jgi:adenine-specific DNA-methyltransferase
MATTRAKATEPRISPLSSAEESRKQLLGSADEKHQSTLGQFLSPLPVAQFMASMFAPVGDSVKLLDPGAGVGSLTAAFVEEICGRKKRPNSVEIVAYEIDPQLQSSLEQTLADCNRRCRENAIEFSSTIVLGDFIESMVAKKRHQLFESDAPSFTHVIMNPPYKKINIGSATRKHLSSVGIETSNLYTAFMLLSVNALVDGGQFVSITPRSFCNGPYFKTFRKAFLLAMHLERLHVFESRKDAFADDSVLQENIIVHAAKIEGKRDRVAISTSASATDLDGTHRVVPYESVVTVGDPDLFIHIAMSEESDAVASRIEQMPSSLVDAELSVSTGRVVDFRAREFLKDTSSENTVPLLYPCNISSFGITWPKDKTKKPQAIICCEETSKLLIKAGCYVLVKRFTTKEEKRRIVAAVLHADALGYDDIGIENHLNYFHCNGDPLDEDVAYGLAAYLNTVTVDNFFRQFNGHTQVNATDLRKLKYPANDILRSIGKQVRCLPEINLDATEPIVDQQLNWLP